MWKSRKFSRLPVVPRFERNITYGFGVSGVAEAKHLIANYPSPNQAWVVLFWGQFSLELKVVDFACHWISPYLPWQLVGLFTFGFLTANFAGNIFANFLEAAPTREKTVSDPGRLDHLHVHVFAFLLPRMVEILFFFYTHA